MTEQIKKLLEFQEADLAVDEAEKKVKTCKERKTATAMKQRYEVAVEERKKLITLRDAAEKELERISKEVEKLASLAEVDRAEKLPEDLESVNKLIADIDKLSAQLKKQEERLKSIHTSVLQNEKKISEYAAVANKARDEFNENKAGYEKILAEAKPELDALAQKRDALQKQVDGTLLTIYQNKKKNKIVPTAPLHDSRCGGCHMELPAFTVSNVTKNGYCECENCGRIVYAE